MKTTELTGALLDYWTARAQGVPADQLEIRQPQPDPANRGAVCIRHLPRDPFIGPDETRMQYSTLWAHGGPLIDKHKINLLDKYYLAGTEHAKDGTWMAYLSEGPLTAGHFGDTALVAICRAVVFTVFGGEVEPVA